MKVQFKPHQREDKRYAIEIFKNDFSIGFVHWIESTDGSICRVNRPDMVMSPIWSEEECQANCNWLETAFKEGKIK
jgi:hypothetical protein